METYLKHCQFLEVLSTSLIHDQSAVLLQPPSKLLGSLVAVNGLEGCSRTTHTNTRKPVSILARNLASSPFRPAKILPVNAHRPGISTHGIISDFDSPWTSLVLFSLSTSSVSTTSCIAIAREDTRRGARYHIELCIGMSVRKREHE